LLTVALSQYPLRDVGGPSEYATLGSDNNIWFTMASGNIGRLNTSSGAIDQFVTPSPNSAPGAIITGSDKNIWFIEQGTNQLATVNPSTGVITEVPILANGNSQIQDLVSGPDGNIWFTEYKANKIGEINPTTHAVQEFSITTSLSQPYDIVKGTDNNLWFTESGTNKIGMINPTTHAVADFTIPTNGNLQAEGLAVTPDGTLWFTENVANAIGSYNPTTKTFNNYTTGLSNAAGLSEIVAGPGGNLWFSETASNRIGQLNPGTGKITEFYDNIYASHPQGLAQGVDGNLYAALNSADSLAKVTSTGTITDVAVPSMTNQGPGSIVKGNDGNLWFVAASHNIYNGNSYLAQVGVFNPATKTSVEYTLPDSNYVTQGIALDSNDGTLWFAEPYRFSFQSDIIATINPTSRKITEYHFSGNSSEGVAGITFNSSDGNLWFTESGSNTIGRINPTSGAITDNFLTLPANSSPNSIVADSQGRLWFTEYGTGAVAVFNPQSGLVTQIMLPANSHPEGIDLGPDGNMWFVETGYSGYPTPATNEIGEISTSTLKVLSETAVAATGNISVGPSGSNSLWFAESGGIGKISTIDRSIVAYPTTNITPQGLATGPDNNVWFAGVGLEIGYSGNYYPNVVGSVDLTSASTATQVDISTQPPSGVTASQGFGVVAVVKNASNQVDTYYNGPVTLSLGQNPGGSTSFGSPSATAVNGVATFTGLTLDQAGTGYTIVAASPGLTSKTSSPITVSLAATHLFFTSGPPGSVSAGTPFPVTVAAEDPNGNIDTSFNGTLTISLGNNPGSSTFTPITLGATAGVLTFPSLSLNNPGAGYTFQVVDASGKLQAGATAGFNVTPQPATHLVFSADPPSPLVAGGTFSLTVTALNDLGQTDTGDNSPVSLQLSGGSGATLGGVVSMSLAAGMATFSGLAIDLAGQGDVIQATSGNLTPATTHPFNVTNASASTFMLATSPPSGIISGVPFTLTVTALDPYGNLAKDYAGTVHFTSSDSHANLPVDTTFGFLNGGSITFNVTLAAQGSQTVTVTDSGNSGLSATATVQVQSATSTTTNLSAAPAFPVYGQPITLTVGVSPNPGNGTVTFLDGSTPLATVPLTANGASYAVINPSTGVHSFQAVYSGSFDRSYAGSTSSTSVVIVGPASTKTTISAPVVSTSPGHAIVVNASVAPVAPGAGYPSGLVTFLDGGKPIGSAPIVGGTASFAFTSAVQGTHSITAMYPGDANFSASTAAGAVSIRVGALAPASFDASGQTNVAIFDKTSATFYINVAGGKTTTFQLGNPGDNNIAVAGDFDGDGTTDMAIYDQTAAKFYVVESSGPRIGLAYGNPLHTNIPVAGKFDGTGKTNFAIYDQTASTFYILGLGGKTLTLPYGNPKDVNIPVAADYDGDGKTDIAIYDQTATVFYVNESSGKNFSLQFGPQGHLNVPLAGDYDGDGKTDLGVYDQTAAKFFISESGGGSIVKQFGPLGDTLTPIAGDYEGYGQANLAIYDSTNGVLYVQFPDNGSFALPFGNKKHNNQPI
jgi:streptogramin lyase